MTQSSEEQKTARLEAIEEYKLLFQRWDDIDRRALTMKGWSTAGFAIVAAISNTPAYSGKLSIISILFLIAGFISIWSLEGIWKSWQHSFSSRIQYIENYFQNGGEFTPFQIAYFWRTQYQPDGISRTNFCLMFQEMIRLSCMMPYIIFILYLVSVLFCYYFEIHITRAQP